MTQLNALAAFIITLTNILYLLQMSHEKKRMCNLKQAMQAPKGAACLWLVVINFFWSPLEHAKKIAPHMKKLPPFWASKKILAPPLG